MCGAAVGTALNRQLGKHLENRPWRRQGPSVRCACEAAQGRSGCVIRGMKSFPRKGKCHSLLQQPNCIGGCILWQKQIVLIKYSVCYPTIPSPCRRELGAMWVSAGMAPPNTYHRSCSFPFCLLDPGHQGNRCLWAPPIPNPLTSMFQWLLIAHPRQLAPGKLEVPQLVSQRMTVGNW